MELTSTCSSWSFCQQLDRIRGGDHEALEELLQNWRPYLRVRAQNLLGRRVATRCDSSDVVQETMLQVHTQFRQFRGHSRGEWIGWIRRILINEAHRTRRHHHAEKRNVKIEVPRSDREISATELDAIAELERFENGVRVLAALEKLPPTMREVIVRRVFEKEVFRDIGRQIDKSEGATRVIWSRGIRRLRILMDELDQLAS